MTEKEYLLWLSRIDSIGFIGQQKLLSYYGFGEEIFKASRESLEKSNILTELNINNILRNQKIDIIQNYLEELQRKDIKAYSLYDDKYPYLLSTIDNPPLILYVKGNLPDFDNKLCISVIGARRNSEYGKMVANNITKDLVVKNDTIIVSGMARGIDTAAHVATINNNGVTVAVLGCGVDVCYPKENEKLMHEIQKNGCIISEFAPSVEPKPGFFPMRNRIISGLCNGLLVVESSAKSGTLITVDYALEQGRIVFAVPGNINSRLSEGTNKLIKYGAVCTTSSDDIFNEFDIDVSKKNNEQKININLTDTERLLYNYIDNKPKTIEELIYLSKSDLSAVMYALTMLEIKGIIKKVSGQKYIKVL